MHCTANAIFDVTVKLRTRRWFGVELSAGSRNALYIPAGFAHGFLTLTDDAEVFYQMGAVYVPGATRGHRFDDPRVGIRWPAPPAVVSERDLALPELADE